MHFVRPYTSRVSATRPYNVSLHPFHVQLSCLSFQIYISSSLANLYEGVKKKDWRLKYTGVPVLCYDKGSAKSRSSPRVTFVLAERGTCFALWRDTIDNLSSYKVSGPAFHTMCLSTGKWPAQWTFWESSQTLPLADHSKIIGFSFDSNIAATEFWRSVERLISNPENIALSAPGRKRKTKKPAKQKPLPPKTQISLPCQFLHVTNVSAEDTPRYHSFQVFMPKNREWEHRRTAERNLFFLHVKKKYFIIAKTRSCDCRTELSVNCVNFLNLQRTINARFFIFIHSSTEPISSRASRDEE